MGIVHCISIYILIISKVVEQTKLKFKENKLRVEYALNAWKVLRSQVASLFHMK